MHARLIKETRPLLPVFGLVLLLIILPYAIWHGDALNFTIFALAIGCVAMGAISFGTEFQCRTLPLLLSQPATRSSLWREKMLILGSGMALSLVVFVAVVGLLRRGLSGRMEIWFALALIPLCAFCVVPYLTLLVRNTIGGVVFSLALAAGIGSLGGMAIERLFQSNMAQLYCAFSLILLCCPVFCWLGYTKFNKLEALDTQSRELSLPAGLENILIRPLKEVSAGFTGPFASLLKKELRLQQVSFLLAGLFCIVAFLGTGWYFFQHESRWPMMILAFDFAVYIFITPLLVGVTAITEERSWGMADWHITLPVSARKQWVAKMLVTQLTSLILGFLLPAILFLLGALLVPAQDRLSFPPLHGILGLVFAYLLLINLAVYAASLSSNTVRGVLLTIGLIIAGGSMVAIGVSLAEIYAFLADPSASANWLPETFLIRRGIPVVSEEFLSYLSCAGMLALILLLQAFAILNYRHRYLTLGRRVTQVLVLLAACCLLTGFIAFPNRLAARLNSIMYEMPKPATATHPNS
jgi:ABC-type transport system involved in multi-copper enzyme maturation permease subunit